MKKMIGIQERVEGKKRQLVADKRSEDARLTKEAEKEKKSSQANERKKKKLRERRLRSPEMKKLIDFVEDRNLQQALKDTFRVLSNGSRIADRLIGGVIRKPEITTLRSVSDERDVVYQIHVYLPLPVYDQFYNCYLLHLRLQFDGKQISVNDFSDWMKYGEYKKGGLEKLMRKNERHFSKKYTESYPGPDGQTWYDEHDYAIVANTLEELLDYLAKEIVSLQTLFQKN